jgi:peptidoglycan/LPS O-acetylase OafA/YrhL
VGVKNPGVITSRRVLPAYELSTVRQVDVDTSPGGLQGIPTAKGGFRPDIEGLRAFAVLAVVLFHANVPGLGGGYVGVDVFFVISGFLITGLLWREVSTAHTVRLGRFYGARARRLLPASAFVGVATAIASTFLLPPLQARSVLVDGITSALYVGNYRFLLEGVDYLSPHMPESPFLHYWSLGVEEQFYLLWPAMILATSWLTHRRFRRSGGRAAVMVRPYLVVLAFVGVVSFALSLVVTDIASFVAFFSLPTRAWQLAAGGLIALTAGQWRRLSAKCAAVAGWAGLALLVVACTKLSTATPYPGSAALLPVAGAALIIGAGCAAPSWGCGRVLSLPPMRAVGRVSYSWYLWHWPVLLLAPVLLGQPLELAGRLVAVLVSLGLAVLTLWLIENPSRFASSLRRSTARSLALGGVATAIAVIVNLALMVLMPAPVGRGPEAARLTVTISRVADGGIRQHDIAVEGAFAQVAAAVTASADMKAVPRNLEPPLNTAAGEIRAFVHSGCMRNLYQAVQPECAMGDTASSTTMALIGDSHATMWVPAFRRIAEEKHWRLEALGKGECPPMNMPVANSIRHVMYVKCEQWRAEIVERMRAERPKLIVLTMFRGYGGGHAYTPAYMPYGRAWLDGLTRLVRELRDIGSHVVVLGPIPDPHSVVPVCLSGHLDDATACSPLTSTAVNRAGIAAELAATESGGGEYVDLTDLFCTALRCPVVVGNALVYFDDNHLTAQYAEALAPVIGAVADRALVRG